MINPRKCCLVLNHFDFAVIFDNLNHHPVKRSRCRNLQGRSHQFGRLIGRLIGRAVNIDLNACKIRFAWPRFAHVGHVANYVNRNCRKCGSLG